MTTTTTTTRQEQEWPVEQTPQLVLFESEEPHFYRGELADTAAVLVRARPGLQGEIDTRPMMMVSDGSLKPGACSTLSRTG